MRRTGRSISVTSRATARGDVFFHLDPLWADPEIDFVGIDNYMPLSDWRDGFEHADAAEGWPAIYDRAYLQANIAGGEGFDWFYASAADRTAQVRTPITDGAAGKPWVFRYKDLRAWWSNVHYNRPGGVESGTPTAWAPQSKPIWFTELGCPAIDRGTNQPNVFFDPKSSESFTPHFSRGWRDDAIQRAYLEATYLWWGEAANNPVSSVYGGRMVHVPECAAWTWDARPYPFFPALTDVWTDGANWRLGHWLTGRLGAVSLAALVRHLCLRAGMPEVADRRHRPLGRGGGLRHHGAGKPARLDHHAVAPLRLRCGGDRGRDPLHHARPGVRRHHRARRSGGRPRGRRAGTDARPGDRTAAGAEMADSPAPTRITTPPSSKRGGSPWTRRGSPRRASRWRCRPRRPSAAAAAR